MINAQMDTTENRQPIKTNDYTSAEDCKRILDQQQRIYITQKESASESKFLNIQGHTY